ncbi:MAG: sugar transferase, partial [Verrucomicrobiota bacterium]
MNTVIDPKRKPSPQVMDHFAAFETPMGRWRHRMYLGWKRVAWRWLVGGAHLMKRTLDIIGSVIALVLLSPVCATVALIIKLEDRGPVLFRQLRVGKNGREFRMLKFRSMRVDAEARLKELLAKNQHNGGITFKIKDDPRVTRIGKWIRKFSV